MRKSSRFRPLKIGDVIVIGILICIIFLVPRNRGEKIKIFVDGKVIRVYSLNMDTTITIQGYKGPSVIQIQKGKVRMLDSTCPLKLCVKMGWISNAGASIVCVPNRVTILIKGKAYWDVITE